MPHARTGPVVEGKPIGSAVAEIFGKSKVERKGMNESVHLFGRVACMHYLGEQLMCG